MFFNVSTSNVRNSFHYWLVVLNQLLSTARMCRKVFSVTLARKNLNKKCDNLATLYSEETSEEHSIVLALVVLVMGPN